MSEKGVTVIDGRSTASRSQSPAKKLENEEEEKPKRFLNGWSKEQERLMAEWSDIAVCYRWLHDNSNKIYHVKTLGISLPVIFLSTISGFSNIGVQAILESEEAKKYASFAIAAISLIAGLLTTVGDRLRYAQLEESHRGAAISWGKFQRLIAVELSLNPIDRMDSLDFLKICRTELDRLIEQSPPIPKESITLFEKKFGNIKDLKKPDICGALEHTYVFESSETRLKQLAVDAALMLKMKKQALNELVTPQMTRTINNQIETRLNEALEARKKYLEEEIERKRQEAEKVNEEFEKALAERKKKIEEEIEIEKKKLYTAVQTPTYKFGESQFENRLKSKNIGATNTSTRSLTHSQLINPSIYTFDDSEPNENIIINDIKNENNNIRKNSDDNIIIINK
jgi:hypothetical protein